MKKRNAKTLVISLALMLVMCVATALLSFSLADDTTPDSGVDASNKSTTRTNIDYIIENSHGSDKDETGRDLSPFYIVEIGSASNANNSPLKEMTLEDVLTDANADDISQFVKQVINGWSTQGKTMKPNKISYKFISASSLSNADAIQDAIKAVGQADLIYVSNDPAAIYDSSNDIAEDVKIALSNAATSTYTPFIIDSPTKTQNGGSGNVTATRNFNNLADNIFATAGYYRDAFSYNVASSKNVENYLNRLDTKSLWLPIPGKTHSDNWIQGKDAPDGTETKLSARILTIHSGDTDNAVTEKFKEAVQVEGASTTYDLANIVALDPTFDPDGKEGYVLQDGSPLKEYGYFATQVAPDNVIFEAITPADIPTTDLGVYDLVIIEKGIGNTKIDNDTYNMFSSMVYGLQHIVYDSTMSSSSGGEEQDDVVKSDAKNYQYVMEKVADAREVSRFSNVLVTGMAEMRIYGAATAPSGVKAIADIINNGGYRGSGGGGSSSNLYTVLEIQPCYPIDLNLAKVLQSNDIRDLAEKARKAQLPNYDRQDIFYYIQGDSVMNNKTSDEISFDGGVTSLSDMESTDNATTGISARGAIQKSEKITKETAKDYYAWELSKAKVAKLTGLEYDQVNVVHMSTVEFNSSRETIMDNYDAIYIGGNYSAIKNLEYWKTEGRSNPALYQMYFHQAGSYNNGDGIGVLTGNDITYNRYVELQEYIAAGMPVVFTKPVVEAYYAAYGTESGDTVTRNYKNKLMDPESNMFLLLRGCMSGTSAVTDPDTGEISYPTDEDKDNVLAGFDPTDQVKIMNDGTLGETYGGYVTVFGGLDTHVMIKDETTGQTVPVTLGAADQTSVNAREFSELLSSSSGRPKFALLQAPPAYIEGDDSTEIRKNSITFKVDVASNEKYKINVYVDDNTNSRFETKECLYSKPGPRDTVTVTFPNTFDGALYWKFEIETTKCKSSVVGISKVHVKTPNYVNVLQIAPEEAKTSVINGYTTLLFCTECQEARGILHGNRYTNTGKYDKSSAYDGSCFYDANFSVGGTLQDPSTYDPGFNNQAKGKELGIHRHNFGIVKYDSNYTLGGWTGLDNWETNWAEDVYNDYDIDMDIWTTREYEAVVKDCQEKVTAANADDVLEKYKSLASIYKTYYLTMKEVVAGTVDTTSTNYIYLKNKLTRNNTAFVEADVNSLFGEEKGVYDLETAKGGFHVSETELATYLTAQKTMKDMLLNVQGHVKSDKASKDQWTQEITYETTYGRYSDFFSMFNASSQITSADSNFTLPANFYDDFVAQFRNWRNAKVFEEYFYKMYMKYLTYSTMKKHGDQYYPDFTQVYSCIVIGVGENFGNDDIKTQAAIDTLKYYIEDNGNTFIFHQTINDGGTTPVMTNNLKTLFGQNYSHVTTKAVKETAVSYVIKSGEHHAGQDPVFAEGTIKENEGLDILIKCVRDNETRPTDITAVPNSTGKVNISWEIRDPNGNLTDGAWSNQKVRLYINGKSEISDAKVEFKVENRASTGTLKDQATITEKAVSTTRYINEAPSDTARYHYTATLDNGKSIKLSNKHLTMVNPGVWGNSEAFSQFTYTQTAILNSDIQIPNRHINFISDMTQYGAFTNRATQINKGVVTMYPFRIASTLKISETHPNSFSTDIEDEDMIVYYALAGGGKGSFSSVAAADPQDGIDNYFLYSYGNVTYCGAGHSLLTGRYRDNNDERRLFINIILNSSKKSVFGPTIDVFDPYPEKNSDGTVKVDGDGNPVYTNNDITPAEDGSYEMVVTSQEDIPEFDYRVRIPDSADEVQHVKIYYDLSPNASGDDYGFVDKTDVLIFESDAKNDDTILKKKHKLISKAIDALKLKPSYFAPYDNKYTYIVIAVKTKKGVIATQRIMVKVAPKLWDLT